MRRTGSRGGAENAEESPRNHLVSFSAPPRLRGILPSLRRLSSQPLFPAASH